MPRELQEKILAGLSFDEVARYNWRLLKTMCPNCVYQSDDPAYVSRAKPHPGVLLRHLVVDNVSSIKTFSSPYTTSVTFTPKFREVLTASDLPPRVTDLTFNGSIDQLLQARQVCPKCQLFYDQPLDVTDRPELTGVFVRHLIVGNRADLRRFSSPYVETVTFKKEFNDRLYPLDIPENVREVTFGEDFNQPLTVKVLPSKLKRLKFGRYYNRRLQPGFLPASLEVLTLGDKYTEPLEAGVLPVGLKYLNVGTSYKQPLPEMPNLQTLVVPELYRQPVPNVKVVRNIYGRPIPLE